MALFIGFLLFFVSAGATAVHAPESCASTGTCGAEQNVADATTLLQASAAVDQSQNPCPVATCPVDWLSQAITFWEQYFPKRCFVDINDLKTELTHHWMPVPFLDPLTSASENFQNCQCKVEIPVKSADPSVDLGKLYLEVGASPAAADTSQAGLEVNNAGQTTMLDPCNIVPDTVPKLRLVHQDALNDALTALNYRLSNISCTHQAVFSGDITLAPTYGKEDQGSYSDTVKFEIEVDLGPTLGVGVKVFANELNPTTGNGQPGPSPSFLEDDDVSSDGSDTEAADVGAEYAKMIGAGLTSEQAGTELAHMVESGEITQEEYDSLKATGAIDAVSYIQGKIAVRNVQNGHQSKLLTPVPAPPSVPSPAPAAIRTVSIVSFHPSPACLCNPASGACTTPSSFFEEEEEDVKIQAQQNMYPELAPNLLLQVKTADAGSHAEHHPPYSPGDVMTPSSFDTIPDEGQGDNFHSVILPTRTADDHVKVWAQSRALIEEVTKERGSLPSSYHFYDTDITSICFQDAYNQGKCGSCWAFASLGALEKQICMNSIGLVRASLSREMLVRCSEQNFACGGGNADKAYEDLMEIGGVFSTDCLPYQGKGSKHCPVFAYSWFGQGSAGKTGKFARIDQELQKSCKDHTRYSNRPPQHSEWDMPFQMMYEKRFGSMPNLNDPRLQRYKENFAKVRSRDRIASWWLYGQDAMKAAITKYGSIYASFKVRDDFKKRMCKDGCWTPGTVYGEESQFKAATCGCGKGHAVHIIGYGEDIQETGTKVPYWLIENSWGTEVHGDVMGEDTKGVKPFGKDPFTEEHPMQIEDKCVLAGWAYSALKKVGGCSGAQNLNIRQDVPTRGGKPDGMWLSAEIDGKPIGNWSVGDDDVVKFSAVIDYPSSRPHNVTLSIYAKNHPKQQGFDVESYGLWATSLRCRGKGFRYSFTQNDTKAKLSWGRKTRQELKKEAEDFLIKASNGKITAATDQVKFGFCPALCRTGRYNWVKPCVGMLSDWGKCYTTSYANRSWMQQHKRADCWLCTNTHVWHGQRALAIQNLPHADFLKWYKIIQLAWDAPDAPGWMRSNTGSCNLMTTGWVPNSMLSATYVIDPPQNTWCDERHSAPYMKGKFVHAPSKMAHQTIASARCPPPYQGSVSLRCDSGTLKVISNTCGLRPGAPQRMLTTSTLGYYKMLRGSNYHGIESGAAFAIAEMHRFTSGCPTYSWSKWSECNATAPCLPGHQNRTRIPIRISPTDPKCANTRFEMHRTCVGPGFCTQVLTRFVAGGATEINDFLAEYKTKSTSIHSNSYAAAGAHMLPTSTPTCGDAQYWCKITTGMGSCDMYFEGHIKVLKDADYNFLYNADEGSGVLEFNTFATDKLLKPQYRIEASVGSHKGVTKMYEWQDLGFHHRRRRSGVKPWVKTGVLKLSRGTYYARMTRTGWRSCPTFALKLEQQSSVYGPPVLLGIHTHASNSQKKFTWQNNWGASWYASWRGRYGSSYGPEQDVDHASHELVLKDEKGGLVIATAPINKTVLTADEMYTLLGVDRYNLPSSFKMYAHLEIVLRFRPILHEKGTWIYKFMIDQAPTTANRAWHEGRRRRQIRFQIRAGGKNAFNFKAWQSSATATVTETVKQAGPSTFEASIMTWYNAPGSKPVLPNKIEMILKKSDTLHGASLSLGSKTKYLSDIVAIRGDDKVRIDWPDRDDPLSSELKTQTFEALQPQALLIGNAGVSGGFSILAEGKIDAGACCAVEAWLPQKKWVPSTAFWGLGVNLCDIDGTTQYLDLVTYGPETDPLKKNNSNMSITRKGWVHIAFTQPTHIQIIRDPNDLGKFHISYKPDNRIDMATPFSTVDVPGFQEDMDVGISMNSPEAYRYAEFYNISIDDCPTSCNVLNSNVQQYCGNMTTACGTPLHCPSVCSSAGDVCKDNICMKCPAAPAASTTWECGTYKQTCVNHKKQKVQLVLDFVSASSNNIIDRATLPQGGAGYHCDAITNKWVCQEKSKWAFLLDGKQCGSIMGNCGKNVTLFPCQYKNDKCMAHKCVCTPSSFLPNLNCGSKDDGCGTVKVFGQCSSTDVCHNNQCCTTKSKSDPAFAGYGCGTKSDGCGGTLDFSSTPPKPFLTSAPSSTYYNHYTGQVGMQFTAKGVVKIQKLGRGLMTGTSRLKSKTTVSLWEVSAKKLIASIDVGPTSTTSGGYAWEDLPVSVTLVKGKTYRLVQRIWRGMPDKWARSSAWGSSARSKYDNYWADFKGEVLDDSNSAGFPEDTYITSYYGLFIVNFATNENDGCGRGLFTCNASTHKCLKAVKKEFTVISGNCQTSFSSQDGYCVTSPSYPNKYSSYIRCEIETPSEGKLVKKDFKLDDYGFGSLIMGSTSYTQRGQPPATKTLVSSEKWIFSASWVPSSQAVKGFKFCVMPASLSLSERESTPTTVVGFVDMEEELIRGLMLDEAPVRLDENQLQQLSGTERSEYEENLAEYQRVLHEAEDERTKAMKEHEAEEKRAKAMHELEGEPNSDEPIAPESFSSDAGMGGTRVNPSDT